MRESEERSMRKIAGILVLAAAMAASLPARGVTVFSSGTLKCGSTINLTLTGITFTYGTLPGTDKRGSSMIVYFPMSSSYSTYEKYSETNESFSQCSVTANVAGTSGLPAAATWTLDNVTFPSITATAGGPSTLEGLTEPFATVALTLNFTKESASSAE
jgi:hypothetical protein